MKRTQPISSIGLACLVGATALVTARAGSVTYDFTTDPTTGSNPIQIYQSGFADSAGNSIYWKADGGNPGGFLAITWPLGSSSTIAVFPDIDQGKIVTSFKFETDLRVGNPQQNVRPADGFSINFARSNDPVFENHSANDFATAGAVETGTQTGIAISFDTWQGNSLPDGADIEGIIVRVDNKTVLRQAMPTRNGACDDNTSLQTGPRNTQYWTDASNNGTLPDAAFAPESWTNLCWQHLSVELDEQSKLTVTYKGRAILDHYQTTFFPSAGGIVLAGRTGGADEHTHFDNLKLTTTATAADTEKPTNPANLKATEIGSYHVKLAWDPATDNSGRVGYDLEQNGTAIGSAAAPSITIHGLSPLTDYTFRVRAADVSGNKSDWISLTVKTIADVPDADFAAIKIYGTDAEPISGTAVDGLLSDARYPDAPDRIVALNGMVMSFGEPAFGNTFGENLGFRIAGTVTPPETGSYRFFVRSDDASQLYLNTSGAAVPVADGLSQIAEETGCCNAFTEPGATHDDMPRTSDPISLQANKQYGILFLVKEGGGGDWGQVAWRKEGDTTPAAQLQPIAAPAFKSDTVPNVDPLGSGPPVITKQPQTVKVNAGGSATFSVTVGLGGKPFSYQWQLKGKPIPGATSDTLTVNNAGAGDAGDYTVVVTNDEGTITSQPANLLVSGVPTALFVVGTASVPTLNASDAAVKARLESLGFAVLVANAPTSKTSDADGLQLVVTSSTVNSGDVANKFQTVAVPVLNGEQALQDNFLFTTDDASTHNTTTSTSETQINIINSDHPLAAGLAKGPLTVSSGTQWGWGVPAPSAVIIATTADDPTQAVIYAFEKGATLVDNTTKAPERRAQFPWTDDSFATLNADGLKLFDAAVKWVANSAGGGGGGQGGRPTLSVARTATGLSITFTGTLQSADSVNGTWKDEPGSSPLAVQASGAAKFYRAKQ